MSRSSPSAVDGSDPTRTVEPPVFVDVWHPRCSACRAVQARLNQLDQRLGEKGTVKHLNVGERPEIVSDLELSGIPTLLVVRENQLQRIHGAEAIQRFADRLKADLEENNPLS